MLMTQRPESPLVKLLVALVLGVGLGFTVARSHVEGLNL